MSVDPIPTCLVDPSKQENIAHFNISRVLWLTLLAPDIVEVILDGRHGPELTLPRMLETFLADWMAQRSHWCAVLR